MWLMVGVWEHKKDTLLSLCCPHPDLLHISCLLFMTTMIMGGRSFKLPYALLSLFVLVHLRLVLGGFIPGVGDAKNISCPEGERQGLLEFKRGISDPYGRLSSWGSEDEKRNCCNWEGIHCSNQTGHVVQLHFNRLGSMISSSLLELPYLYIYIKPKPLKLSQLSTSA